MVRNNKLVGIITNRDMQFHTDDERPVLAQMTSENLVTVPVGTSLEKSKEILQKYQY